MAGDADEPKIGENRGNAGKGRPKGALNKTTAVMKAAIEAVFADLQDNERDKGEIDNEHAHFLKWALDNPTEFYKLASKLIPIQLGSDPDNPFPAGFVLKGVPGAGD